MGEKRILLKTHTLAFGDNCYISKLHFQYFILTDVCVMHIFTNKYSIPLVKRSYFILDRTTNLLGALAIAVTDRMEVQMRETLNRSGEAAAAIVFLGYVPGLSVEILRQVLVLSHPGTVRLVDRLKEDGLVERRKTDDGRAVALHLTLKGKKLRERLMNSRLDMLETALAGLTKDERATFGNLIAKALMNLPKKEIDKHHICRLCSVKLCSSDCPIPGNAPILDPYRKSKASAK